MRTQAQIRESIRRNQIVSNYIFPAIIATIISLIEIFMIVAEYNLPQERKDVTQSEISYTGEWIRVTEDGKTEEITVPGKFKTEKGTPLVIETILPEHIPDAVYFCFNSTHESVKIYLKDASEYGSNQQGRLLTEYTQQQGVLYGNNMASGYAFTLLDKSMAEQVLRVEITSTSIYSGNVAQPYYGSMADILNYISRERYPGFILAVVLLIVGLMILASCLILAVMRSRSKILSMVFVGLNSLCMGAWILFESRFRQVLFQNYSIAAIMAFAMMLMIPATAILYINDMQQYRHKWMHCISETLLISTLLILMTLHLTKVLDAVQTMYINYVVCYITLFSIFVSVIIDIKDHKLGRYRASTVGFMVYFGASLAEIFLDMGVQRNTGFIMGLGALVFVVGSFYNTAYVMLQDRTEKNKAVAQGEAKSMFLANMSHEIRTPLNAVLGMNEMILRDSKDDSVIEYAQNIDESGRLLLSIINDILDVSKMQSGKLEIVPAEYKMSAVLNNLITTLKPKAENKELSFVYEIDPDLPENLYGDEVRVRQIAINLINNAIKYTDEGSVKFSVSGYKKNESYILKLKVSDTGRGIKEEDQKNLFDVFSRIEEQSNHHIEGTGLGLSIVKNLCELMGGKVNLVSTYGLGSVFEVFLPQKQLSDERIGNYEERVRKNAEKQKKNDERFTAPGARILVVDDTAMNLKVITMLLRDTLAEVTTAESGAEALELLGEREYDLIMIDHMMPEMDGVETLIRIKEDHPSVTCPIIALTANAFASARETYQSYGFSDYLSKPVVLAELDEILRLWCKAKPTEEA